MIYKELIYSLNSKVLLKGRQRRSICLAMISYFTDAQIKEHAHSHTASEWWSQDSISFLCCVTNYQKLSSLLIKHRTFISQFFFVVVEIWAWITSILQNHNQGVIQAWVLIWWLDWGAFCFHIHVVISRIQHLVAIGFMAVCSSKPARGERASLLARWCHI